MHRIGEGDQIRCSRGEVIAEIILFILPSHVHSKAGLFDPAADPVGTYAMSLQRCVSLPRRITATTYPARTIARHKLDGCRESVKYASLYRVLASTRALRGRLKSGGNLMKWSVPEGWGKIRR